MQFAKLSEDERLAWLDGWGKATISLHSPREAPHLACHPSATLHGNACSVGTPGCPAEHLGAAYVEGVTAAKRMIAAKPN